MAKKDFTGKFGKLLGEPEKADPEAAAMIEDANKALKTAKAALSEPDKKKVGRPKRTGDKEIRATMIVAETTLEALKDIAYWERKQIKTVIGEALDGYVKRYLKDKGELKPRAK